MKHIVAFIVALISSSAMAYTQNEIKYMPLLKTTIDRKWASMPHTSVLAGQIKKESRWNPNARLKTSREEGVNFGQITKTAKFDNFKSISLMDPELKGWKWDDRFDPQRGMIAFVVYDKYIFDRIKWTADKCIRLEFMLSAYNGGLGGVLQDRKLCQATKGCDHNVWFNNVEKTSYKAKTKIQGYGQSMYDINRSYVSDIVLSFAPYYASYYKDTIKCSR